MPPEAGPGAGGEASFAAGQRPLLLAPCLAGGDRLAAVVELFAARDADLQLGKAFSQVEEGRDERQAALLRLPVEAVDFGAVQEQLAAPAGVDVRPPALLVG